MEDKSSSQWAVGSRQWAVGRTAIAGSIDGPVGAGQVHDAWILVADLDVARPDARRAGGRAVVQHFGRHGAELSPVMTGIATLDDLRAALRQADDPPSVGVSLPPPDRSPNPASAMLP
jgi:hypothetical protein